MKARRLCGSSDPHAVQINAVMERRLNPSSPRSSNRRKSRGLPPPHRTIEPSETNTCGLIFRSLGNRGAVFVAGERAPIVGRISMDLMTADIGHLSLSACRVGDPVEIIGPHQSVDDLARDAGTIGYEILTALGNRYLRRYHAAGSRA